jgi:AAA domain
MMVPLVDGHPVGSDELQHLPQATRDALNSAQHDIEEEIAELVRTFRQIDREAHERVRTLDRDIALFAVGHLIDDVKARFAQTRRSRPGWSGCAMT